ncbi:hypothetical protein [Maridesulfovibrio zosterae]|uniref:prenylated flavin chaperone LpdD n=1 Tax=Maridesulfovibrio zosterae TaxID=82171 RepID=UPI000487A532|nr:hypothetical protein [Maridesulfovibrio zosterae]
MIVLERNTLRFSIRMHVICMGNDLCVSIGGGDKSHIGAVALAISHRALSGCDKIDASVSLLTVTGHKEDELARKVAYKLAVEFNCTVSVSCGIHLDGASIQEITQVLDEADGLLGEAVVKLKEGDYSRSV